MLGDRRRARAAGERPDDPGGAGERFAPGFGVGAVGGIGDVFEAVAGGFGLGVDLAVEGGRGGGHFGGPNRPKLGRCCLRGGRQ